MGEDYNPSIYETSDFHTKVTKMMGWWWGLTDNERTTLSEEHFKHDNWPTLSGAEITAIYELIKK